MALHSVTEQVFIHVGKVRPLVTVAFCLVGLGPGPHLLHGDPSRSHLVLGVDGVKRHAGVGVTAVVAMSKLNISVLSACARAWVSQAFLSWLAAIGDC